MHLLIVTPYYWPILRSSTHLIKTLAEDAATSGMRVSVLTNAPRGGESVEDPPCLRDRIYRIWNPFLNRMGVLPKLCEYLWYLACLIVQGLVLRDVDVLFVASTPPLAGLPAALLARLLGAKMVYNLQDIFPDSAVVAGLLPAEGRLYRWLRKAEAATYRHSHLVASISDSFSVHVQALAPGTPVATIPNWVDTDEIYPKSPDEDPRILELRQGGAFVVQYAGTIGFMQNLDMVVLAAELLQDEPGLKFVFIGDGNAKESLEAMVKDRAMKHCAFLPMQPLDQVPAVYNACDLGVIPLKPGAAHIAVPSKTWNYLAAGRPVIGCVEEGSPLAGSIHASGAGSVVPPGDALALAETIRQYIRAKERVKSEGQSGRAYVEAHLSRTALIQDYLQLFEALASSPLEGKPRLLHVKLVDWRHA